MPIHIRRHDKNSTSAQLLDISLFMTGSDIFSQASYTALVPYLEYYTDQYKQLFDIVLIGGLRCRSRSEWGIGNSGRFRLSRWTWLSVTAYST